MDSGELKIEKGYLLDDGSITSKDPKEFEAENNSTVQVNIFKGSNPPEDKPNRVYTDFKTVIINPDYNAPVNLHEETYVKADGTHHKCLTFPKAKAEVCSDHPEPVFMITDPNNREKHKKITFELHDSSDKN